MAKIDALFRHVVKVGASDLHMPAGSPPYIRVDGDLIRIDMPPLAHEQNLKVFEEIIPETRIAELRERRQVDFVYCLDDGVRFRANVFFQRTGISGVFRLIPARIKTVTELGVPDAVVRLCNLKRGLVLVTGPTGSGKSTTLASLIDYINETRPAHIVTIEDPIEFVHSNKRALITQRQVGEHVRSFAESLRATLREDPDVILVGEMRDLETISLAITAAETGHLVFGTLHTNSAVKTVDRLIDAFPTNQQEQVRIMLSETLRGVVAQVLLRRAEGKGRVAAFEVLVGTPALSALIRENKTHQIPSLMQTQRALGMCLMDQALLDLVKQNKVTVEEASQYAQDRKLFLGQMTRPQSPLNP